MRVIEHSDGFVGFYFTPSEIHQEVKFFFIKVRFNLKIEIGMKPIVFITELSFTLQIYLSKLRLNFGLLLTYIKISSIQENFVYKFKYTG